MKKLKTKMYCIICILLVSVFFTGCTIGSTPKDLIPVINGQFKDAKAVYYPSTDYKASAIVIDKNGDVYYIRANGFGNVKDLEKLFNISEYSN